MVHFKSALKNESPYQRTPGVNTWSHTFRDTTQTLSQKPYTSACNKYLTASFSLQVSMITYWFNDYLLLCSDPEFNDCETTAGPFGSTCQQ